MSESDKSRFEAKVSPCPASGCYLFIGASDAGGYGRFGFRPHGKSNYRPVAAHRAAWEIYVGPIPDGYFVCHHCDNPMCVRIEHLFLGTPKDNTADMKAKGRMKFPPKLTRCKNGHEFAGDNLIIRKDRSSACKICARDRLKKFRSKQKMENKNEQ